MTGETKRERIQNPCSLMARLEIWEDNSAHRNPWKAVPLAPVHYLSPLTDSPLFSLLHFLRMLTGLLTPPEHVFPLPPPWIFHLTWPSLSNHHIFVSHPGIKVWLKCHRLCEKHKQTNKQMQQIFKNTLRSGNTFISSNSHNHPGT